MFGWSAWTSRWIDVVGIPLGACAIVASLFGARHLARTQHRALPIALLLLPTLLGLWHVLRGSNVIVL